VGPEDKSVSTGTQSGSRGGDGLDALRQSKWLILSPGKKHLTRPRLPTRSFGQLARLPSRGQYLKPYR
jgi:hypothetical protein